MNSIEAVLAIYREVAKAQEGDERPLPHGPAKFVQLQNAKELFLTLVDRYFPGESLADFWLIMINARDRLIVEHFLVLVKDESGVWVDMNRPAPKVP